MRSVSEAVVDMATGEVRELELRGEFNLSEEDHLDVLRRKTAAFIEACCEVGVVIAGGSETARHSLKKYGHHIGLAFQIVDDLLDYQGDQAKTGKPVATDFREGQATLPLIYLREQLSEAESMIAKQGFGNGASDDDVRMIADWMQTRGAFEKARRTAVEHVHLALDALKPMPPSPSLELMVAVAEYVLNRQS
jgi:octaprenyl-diphosphate synthase